MNPSFRTVILACTAICLAAGCNGNSGPPTVKVSGRVTFDSAPPPAEGTLFFLPVSVPSGLPRQPGQADFNTEGEFQVTSYQEHDGLVPGTYMVKVECWKNSSGYIGDAAESYVPKDFQAPELVVPAEAPEIEFNLDVK